MRPGITTGLNKIKALKKRLRIVQGGSSASKTYSILIVLIDLAQRDKKPTLTSVVSETFPHLKKGSVKDFLEIMGELNLFKPRSWNKTDYVYTFETGSKIEFFSADQPGKVRGPRRDRLFINEANNVPFETFEQLEIRTNDFIFIDYNPVAEFWVSDEIFGKRDDYEHIVLTYKDNEALGENIIRSLESRKDRPNFWKVYGLGEFGELEGKIYSGWQIIDKIPHEARLERRGLDFGYSIDPTALVDVYYLNGGYILDEQLYSTGLSNKQIADFVLDLTNHPETLVIADSAEPKSIDEIYSYGVNIRGAEKGKDSVRQGIQFIQDLPISITKRSTNLIKEYRNYTWATDRLGKTITPNMPEDAFNDCLDAARYALSTLERRDPAKEKAKLKNYVYQRQQKQKEAKKQYGL
ncbi:MAG: terminase large subunit [Methanogenium sp.]|jgi:phage terminase large subunit